MLKIDLGGELAQDVKDEAKADTGEVKPQTRTFRSERLPSSFSKAANSSSLSHCKASRRWFNASSMADIRRLRWKYHGWNNKVRLTI